MIPATKTVPAGNATSAAAAASGADAPTTDFDAILSLETLAATTATDVMAGAAFSLEGACLEALTEGELTDGDDNELETEDGEAIGALAFLADLLNVAAVTRQATAGDADSELAANDDVMSGSAKPAGEVMSADATVTAAGEDVAADKPSVQGTLQAAVFDAGVELVDAARPKDELASVTRAAEWVQGPRHASAGPERSAIATHVRDPRWAEEFGTRIALMVRGGESSASLQLSPVDLGPMDVSVTVKDNQASIHFGAAQAETRALIEASLPRLREILAAQGFQLMDSSVSQGFARSHRDDATPAVHAGRDPEPSTTETRRLLATSLLDVYA